MNSLLNFSSWMKQFWFKPMISGSAVIIINKMTVHEMSYQSVNTNAVLIFDLISFTIPSCTAGSFTLLWSLKDIEHTYLRTSQAIQTHTRYSLIAIRLVGGTLSRNKCLICQILWATHPVQQCFTTENLDSFQKCFIRKTQ